MYRLVNENIKPLLNSITPEKDITPYLWLLRELQNGDITKNKKFQSTYKHYWKMSSARLSETFLNRYFELLEHSKYEIKKASVKSIALQLYSTPTHNNRNSLQFSFSSKLVHMIAPQNPIYDSMIESFYFLPPPKNKETEERKIERLVSSYNFLRMEYKRISEQNLLGEAITHFQQHFKIDNSYTESKIIDTLIWKFVTLLKRGSVRNGTIIYTK